MIENCEYNARRKRIIPLERKIITQQGVMFSFHLPIYKFGLKILACVSSQRQRGISPSIPFLRCRSKTKIHIVRPPSSVLCPLSSILCPLSSILCPPFSVLCPLSSVLRPPGGITYSYGDDRVGPGPRPTPTCRGTRLIGSGGHQDSELAVLAAGGGRRASPLWIVVDQRGIYTKNVERFTRC